MVQTELKKLATAYAADEIGFLEYRRYRAQFISSLVGEMDHDNARSLEPARAIFRGRKEGDKGGEQGDARPDGEGKPLISVLLTSITIFILLAVVLFLIL